MNFTITSDLAARKGLPGRLRLISTRRLTEAKAGGVEEALLALPFVSNASASYITGSIIVCYDEGYRKETLDAITELVPTEASGERAHNMNLSFRLRLTWKLLCFVIRRLLLPYWLQVIIALFESIHYLRAAVDELINERKVSVSVLDFAAVTGSMLSGDFRLASSVMLLLSTGEMLEEHTKSVARRDLARSLAMHVDTVWVRTDAGDKQITLDDLNIGDKVIVRTGSFIPVDGDIVEGEAAVNQASMTGEPLAVLKSSGDSVFAGTTIEEGNLVVQASALASESRIAYIIEMIEESERHRAHAHTRAERLADGIVPFNFLLSAVAYTFLGPQAGLAALLVHYSCTIHLATPIAVLSALREAAQNKLAVRGGRYLEAAAEADTVVFDKTGTLTTACPEVAHVGAFGSWKSKGILRLAACLEEHFPHSLARAVVRRAEEEGVAHSDEEHGELEYITARGIATTIGKRRVVLGSRRFVIEDEAVACTAKQLEHIDAETNRDSALYLGVGGRLAGFLCIVDPPRQEAADVISELKAQGVERVIMLTGDSEHAARSTAQSLGITEYKAAMLPEDKRDFVMALKAEGRKIMMVGDGINDSPSLAEADVSVAMRDGADLARETSNITLLGGDLHGLTTLRELGRRLLLRIDADYRYIISVNTALFALGLTGVVTPATLAVLHNTSTVVISAASMQPLLEESAKELETEKGVREI